MKASEGSKEIGRACVRKCLRKQEIRFVGEMWVEISVDNKSLEVINKINFL